MNKLDQKFQLVTAGDQWPIQRRAERLMMPAVFWARLENVRKIISLNFDRIESLLLAMGLNLGLASAGSLSEQIMRVAQATSFSMPSCMIQSEWLGGDSSDAKHYTGREPGIVGIPWSYRREDMVQYFTATNATQAIEDLLQEYETEEEEAARLQKMGESVPRLVPARVDLGLDKATIRPCTFCHVDMLSTSLGNYELRLNSIHLPVCSQCSMFALQSIYWHRIPYSDNQLYCGPPKKPSSIITSL